MGKFEHRLAFETFTYLCFWQQGRLSDLLHLTSTEILSSTTGATCACYREGEQAGTSNASTSATVGACVFENGDSKSLTWTRWQAGKETEG